MDNVLEIQQILDECARQIRRLHDWKQRTEPDTGSYGYYRKDAEMDTYVRHAHFILGVANRAGIHLDETQLDKALERGDFL